MSPTGTDLPSFVLTGQTVYRKDGALRLADGTLAGADLTLPDAIRIIYKATGTPLDEALRMASRYPAETLGVANDRGRLARGARADFAVFDDALKVQATYLGGAQVWRA